MSSYFKTSVLLILSILFIACEQQDNKDKIIAINNEFIENNFEQRMAARMLELYSDKELVGLYNILYSIEEEMKQGNNISNRLDSLIPMWKSNFDSSYSKDFFERVDRNFTLFKGLDNRKDSIQVKNLFYMIKYEMLNRHLVDIIGPCITPFNHKVITVVETSNIVRVGEEIELNIFYGALDSLMSYKVYIGGYHNNEFRSDLITDTIEVDNGIGIYTLKPEKTGDTIVEGVVEIKTKQGPMYYPFTKKITIFE